MKGKKYLLLLFVCLFVTAAQAQTVTVVNDTALGKSSVGQVGLKKTDTIATVRDLRFLRDSTLRAKRDSALLAKKMIPKKPKPIRTEFSGGLRLNSDGWSIFADKGWVVSEEKKRDYFYDVRVLQVEFSEKKHPKEVRSTNVQGPYSDEKPRGFAYAKMNNFYTFKVGYGKRKMIAGKPEYKSVSVHLVYMAGLSAGLLKPYYIDVDSFNIRTAIKFTEEANDTTKALFLSRQNIYGGSGFTKGLNETSIVPGAFVKTALHFDFAANKTRIMAIEAGVNIEMYSKKIEMMALQEARAYFVNVYASIQFGKRKQ